MCMSVAVSIKATFPAHEKRNVTQRGDTNVIQKLYNQS